MNSRVSEIWTLALFGIIYLQASLCLSFAPLLHSTRTTWLTSPTTQVLVMLSRLLALPHRRIVSRIGSVMLRRSPIFALISQWGQQEYYQIGEASVEVVYQGLYNICTTHVYLSFPSFALSRRVMPVLRPLDGYRNSGARLDPTSVALLRTWGVVAAQTHRNVRHSMQLLHCASDCYHFMKVTLPQ